METPAEDAVSPKAPQTMTKEQLEKLVNSKFKKFCKLKCGECGVFATKRKPQLFYLTLSLVLTAAQSSLPSRRCLPARCWTPYGARTVDE